MAQHEEIGKRLKRILAELMDLSLTIDNKYPRNHPRIKNILNGIGWAKKKLNISRSELEELMYQENPEFSSTKVYYGQDGHDIEKLEKFT